MSLQLDGDAQGEFNEKAIQHDLFHSARFELGGRFREAVPFDVGVGK